MKNGAVTAVQPRLGFSLKVHIQSLLGFKLFITQGNCNFIANVNAVSAGTIRNSPSTLYLHIRRKANYLSCDCLKVKL